MFKISIESLKKINRNFKCFHKIYMKFLQLRNKHPMFRKRQNFFGT